LKRTITLGNGKRVNLGWPAIVGRLSVPTRLCEKIVVTEQGYNVFTFFTHYPAGPQNVTNSIITSYAQRENPTTCAIIMTMIINGYEFLQGFHLMKTLLAI
jgi:hypothetical protein